MPTIECSGSSRSWPLSIEKAIELYFEDAESRHLARTTLRKRRELLEGKLLPFCKEHGLRLLKQLDVPTLRTLRNGWSYSALSAVNRFRDTFAVSLLLKGVQLPHVSILLGHASITITERHYAPWVKARQEPSPGRWASSWSSAIFSQNVRSGATVRTVKAQSPQTAGRASATYGWINGSAHGSVSDRAPSTKSLILREVVAEMVGFELDQPL